ncbi:MAG: redox-sensitive transcriptional activator SoxR [Parvibaculaceae bacterium]|nr:redox-sensitive transcriptional activator SoxR [Parvibaculaceae bacterium]
MQPEQATLTVGYVAKRTGVNVSALHFYERKGLIRSWRTQGNQRLYRRDVLRRISVIKAAQKIGVSLESIKQTFSSMPNDRTPNKDDWAELSTSWRAQLDQKIAHMERLRDKLGGCIGCGCLSLSNCPIYNPDDVLAAEGPGPVILDRD